MMTIYLDSDFKCYASGKSGFDGKYNVVFT